MFKAIDTQGTLLKTVVNDYLLTWLEAFMIDRKAQGVSEGTLHFYEVKFKSFIRYCENEHIKYVQQITPIVIREYILWLEDAGHNSGWRLAHYRAIRSFLSWFENEVLGVTCQILSRNRIFGYYLSSFYEIEYIA